MDNDISRCERYPTSRYARVEVGPLDHEAEYPIVGIVVVQPQCLLHPIHYLAELFISIFYDM